MYDIPKFAAGEHKGLARDYPGRKFDLTDKRPDVPGHVNIIHPEAVKCNDDAAAFFRKYV